MNIVKVCIKCMVGHKFKQRSMGMKPIRSDEPPAGTAPKTTSNTLLELAVNGSLKQYCMHSPTGAPCLISSAKITGFWDSHASYAAISKTSLLAPAAKFFTTDMFRDRIAFIRSSSMSLLLPKAAIMAAQDCLNRKIRKGIRACSERSLAASQKHKPHQFASYLCLTKSIQMPQLSASSRRDS